MFATEHLEKYVMLKLYRVAFHECVESARERDTWFEKRMQVLRKILTSQRGLTRLPNPTMLSSRKPLSQQFCRCHRFAGCVWLFS